MLRPANEPLQEPGEDRSIGEIVGQLVDDGKAYAQAEFDVGKALAAAKARALRAPLLLLVGSLFVAFGAVSGLCLAIVLALDEVIGHLLAGFVAFVLIGGAAAVLAWLGVNKLKAIL
jgi:hypothetical protein